VSVDWSFVRLKDYCTKIGSGSTPRGGANVYLDSGNVCLIRSQNIYNDGFSENGLVFISDSDAEKLNNVEIELNDVLINITGDSVARVCLAPKDKLPARVNQHVAIIRTVKNELDPKFVRYFLPDRNTQNHLLTLAGTGATRNALTKGMLEEFLVPKPDILIQKKISKILSDLDEKIHLNNQINQTLESIAQTIFKSWFIDFEPVRAKIAAKQEGTDTELAAMCAISGKSEAELKQMAEDDLAELQATAALFPEELVESELGEVPKGWEILDIDKTTSLIIDHRGKTPKKLGSDWSDTGITVLSAKHIKDGYIVNREQLRFVDRELYNKWMKEELEEGDILLTSEGPMGEMYYLASDEKYCLSQRLYALRANTDLISSAFLYFWLLSPYAKSDMNGRATGTTVVGIRQSELRKVKVLTPPKNICDLFNEKVKANLKQIALNNNKSVDLAHIRDILLPKLMAGDLTLSVGC